MRQKRIVQALPALLIAAGAVAGSSGETFAASAAHKYKGAVEQIDRWGPIQVTITVQSKKITNVSAAVSPHTPRSEFIDSQALPTLKQEVLKAQGATIDTVSGATQLSQAYIQSLQSAITKARQAKTLK